jgi:hypothetical protein
MELNHPDDHRNTRAYLEAAYRYLIEDNLRLSEALSDCHAEVKHLRAILNTLQRVQWANGGDKDALSRGHRSVISKHFAWKPKALNRANTRRFRPHHDKGSTP